MAMASEASVTVSIAELRRGTFSFIFLSGLFEDRRLSEARLILPEVIVRHQKLSRTGYFQTSGSPEIFKNFTMLQFKKAM
jgi:hypothetical protein